MHILKRIIRKIYLRIKYRDLILLGDATIRSSFGGNNYIGRDSTLDGRIGYASYIGNGCEIIADIGKYTCIGHDVKTVITIHPLEPFVSIHPMFYSIRDNQRKTYVHKQVFDEYKYADKKNRYGVIIGNDVWIGNRVTIMGGLHIGDGAVIATGAVVTHNVPPYTIVGGIPARLIRQRFKPQQSAILCLNKWWDRPEEWLKNHVDYFDDIDEFIALLNSNNDNSL